MQKHKAHHQSDSLWNYTLSPGWTEQEVSVLKLALMRYGIGRWRKIINCQCMPGKSIGQIYMQTQRLLGQQSLGEFMGLSIDMEKIYLRNMQCKTAFRKNNIIINTGDNMTQEQRKQKINDNRIQFGISQQQLSKITLPKYHVSSTSSFLTLEEMDHGKFTSIDKIKYMTQLEIDIKEKINKIDKGEIEEQDEDIPQHQRPKKRTISNTKIPTILIVVNLLKDKKGRYHIQHL